MNTEIEMGNSQSQTSAIGRDAPLLANSEAGNAGPLTGSSGQNEGREPSKIPSSLQTGIF